MVMESGAVLEWVRSMKNRMQRVIIEESESDGSVLSGVPQGSVLRPLIFVIYINN